MMDLQQRQTSGLGWYSKKKTWKQHIIVAGGAVNEFNLEVLTAFVHQCVKPVRPQTLLLRRKGRPMCVADRAASVSVSDVPLLCLHHLTVRPDTGLCLLCSIRL